MAGGNWLERHLQKHQAQINSLLERIGYDTRDWARVVMNDVCAEWLRELHPDQLDALEISAGTFWRTLGFKSFTEANYPEYDVCACPLDESFDVIIADQIFEHLLTPHQAARHVHQMLNPGGYFLISTPFMIRVHLAPVDCSRWTETGMRQLLSRGWLRPWGHPHGLMGQPRVRKSQLPQVSAPRLDALAGQRAGLPSHRLGACPKITGILSRKDLTAAPSRTTLRTDARGKLRGDAFRRVMRLVRTACLRRCLISHIGGVCAPMTFTDQGSGRPASFDLSQDPVLEFP